MLGPDNLLPLSLAHLKLQQSPSPVGFCHSHGLHDMHNLGTSCVCSRSTEQFAILVPGMTTLPQIMSFLMRNSAAYHDTACKAPKKGRLRWRQERDVDFLHSLHGECFLPLFWHSSQMQHRSCIGCSNCSQHKGMDTIIPHSNPYDQTILYFVELFTNFQFVTARWF